MGSSTSTSRPNVSADREEESAGEDVPIISPQEKRPYSTPMTSGLKRWMRQTRFHACHGW